MSLRPKPSTLVLLAFAAVYIFWGSTYLAISIAGEHLSAAIVSGTRCAISVVFIFAIALVRGLNLRVAPGEFWKLALIGFLFMSGNNMLLTLAEQMVPSGYASLIVSTMPIMIALLSAILPGGEALNARGWAGTLLGTAGIVVLVYPSLHKTGLEGYSRPLLGTMILLVAAFSFAVGSILARRFQFQTDTFVATGWQLAVAGVFNLAVATVTGGFRHPQWTARGVAAILYLAIFGSLFGLVAFTYLLKNVAVTKVSTYAFVNPMIAVLLGVLVLHERLVRTEIAGMAIIVCAVAMVIYSRVARSPARELPTEPA